MLFTLLETPANPITPANQWVLIALAGLTILYVAFVRPAAKRRKRDPLEPKAAPTSLAQQRSIERDMSNLLVEYEEMIRRMTAQVDARAARLELLIGEADEKIAVLRSLGAGAGALREAGKGEIPHGGPNGQADQAEAAQALPDADPIDRRHQDVYDLADSGLTPRRIAQQLDRPNGEIELILALRAKRS